MLSTSTAERSGALPQFPEGKTLHRAQSVPDSRSRGLRGWSEHGRHEPRGSGLRIALGAAAALLGALVWFGALAASIFGGWTGGLRGLVLDAVYLLMSGACLALGFLSGGRRATRRLLWICVGIAAALAIGGRPAEQLLLEPQDWPFTDGPVMPWTALVPCLVACGLGVLTALLMPRSVRSTR